MKKRVIDIAVACVLLLSVCGSGLFAYFIIGEPVSLHHAVERTFDNRISEYHIEGDTLTVVADNFGWDGTGWSESYARTEGERQIKTLQDTIPEYNKDIKNIDLTITYLDRTIMKTDIPLTSE